MTIEFYFMAPSPPSRVVWMVLKALELEFEPKIIDLTKGEQKLPEYLAINPRGKIPGLKDGEFAITESRAIATYLCNQYEKGDNSKRLYPTDPKVRGIVDQILYVSEYVDEMVKQFVNARGVIFAGEKPKESSLHGVYQALILCENYLEKNRFMASDHLTLADFFILAPMQSLQVPGVFDICKYSKITAWLEKMKSLPYYGECNDEGLRTFATSYHNALAKTRQTKAPQ